MTYADWIEAFVASQPNGFVRGKCSAATAEMVKMFPELRRVAGFAHVSWGRDQHWWCVAPDGSVVDPTVAQFGAIGVIKYEEVDIADPAAAATVPTGVCMDCGGDVYNDDTFCSAECQEATAAYLNGSAPL